MRRKAIRPVGLFLLFPLCLMVSTVHAQTETLPADDRPTHDDRRLERFGIRVYESTHLKLYTDIDPETARTLPGDVDRLFVALAEYFGKLPPDPSGRPFQITGYLMRDADRFQQLGLIPRTLPKFLNGRHRGREFWMYEQDYDYYRRHLLLHEATHCFMTIRQRASMPLWYLEGMAELFGTHERDASGLQFGVMPRNRNDYRGLGRVALVQREITEGRLLELPEVFALRSNDYLKNRAYAWSWAVCWFLDNHPRYRERFRSLEEVTTGGRFNAEFDRLFRADLPVLEQEWRLFAASLTVDFELRSDFATITRTAPLFGTQTMELDSDMGWRATGVKLRRGDRLNIACEGKFTLATQPKPWVSEPQGITLTYHRGRPLGEVIAIVDETLPDGERAVRRLPIGRGTTLEMRGEGTVFLRVNDYWSDLDNNSGSVRVTLSR